MEKQQESCGYELQSKSVRSGVLLPLEEEGGQGLARDEIWGKNETTAPAETTDWGACRGRDQMGPTVLSLVGITCAMGRRVVDCIAIFRRRNSPN